MTATKPVGRGVASDGNATLILVLGILSVVCCCVPLGPVVWYLGRVELNGIAEGRIPGDNEGIAKAGMILGIICTVALLLFLLWIAFFGGLVVFESMTAVLRQ